MFQYVLMSSGVGDWLGGKRSSTTIKDTQRTATVPIGLDHQPRLNGPGFNRSLPPITETKIGTVYEV
jgi:hypothetical protein